MKTSKAATSQTTAAQWTKSHAAFSKTLMAIAITSTLAACGGGGGGSSDTSTVNNNTNTEQLQVANSNQTESTTNADIEKSAATVNVENGVQTTQQTTAVGTVTTVENVPTEDTKPAETTTQEPTVTSTRNNDGSVTVSGLTSVDQQSNKTTDLGNCTDYQDKIAILKAINNIRATGRMCGETFYPAAKALTWNDQLAGAALNHATYMITTGEFSHTQTTEGFETIGKRVSSTGYNWMGVGENIASGNVAYENVLDGWVKSPGHCANLMDARFEEFGGACMASTDGKIATKWAQAFAKPRS